IVKDLASRRVKVYLDSTRLSIPFADLGAAKFCSKLKRTMRRGSCWPRAARGLVLRKQSRDVNDKLHFFCKKA
ncbi:MAG: hypothetical protein ACQERT_06890, partial [Thermodesulfobacteriota bacterium]